MLVRERHAYTAPPPRPFKNGVIQAQTETVLCIQVSQHPERKACFEPNKTENYFELCYFEKKPRKGKKQAAASYAAATPKATGNPEFTFHTVVFTDRCEISEHSTMLEPVQNN